MSSFPQYFQILENNAPILENVLQFLDLESLMKIKHYITQKPNQKKTKKQFISQILKGQMPSHKRYKFWMQISQADKIKESNEFDFQYLQTLQSKHAEEIEQDVHRTPFPKKNNQTYQKQKQNDLRAILNCISIIFPQIGYTQGLNFIVAVFLQELNQEDTFYIMVSLLRNYNCKEFFEKDLTNLQLACQILDNLIKVYIPDLSHFLQQRETQPALFATPWFQTLFSYDFRNTKIILDLFLLKGWKIIFKIGLSMLQEVKETLLQTDPDDNILEIIKNASKNKELKILNNSQNFQFSNRMIQDLSNILTFNSEICHLTIIFDQKTKKRKWEYTVLSDTVQQPYSDSFISQSVSSQQLFSERNLVNNNNKNRQQQEKKVGFLSRIWSNLTLNQPEQLKQKSKNLEFQSDFRKSIECKKTVFKNIGAFQQNQPFKFYKCNTNNQLTQQQQSMQTSNYNTNNLKKINKCNSLLDLNVKNNLRSSQDELTSTKTTQCRYIQQQKYQQQYFSKQQQQQQQQQQQPQQQQLQQSQYQEQYPSYDLDFEEHDFEENYNKQKLQTYSSSIDYIITQPTTNVTQQQYNENEEIYSQLEMTESIDTMEAVQRNSIQSLPTKLLLTNRY